MPTARITKEVEFDAGHRVPSHGSKCRNPHGHRYRVRVECEGPIVDDPGAPDDGMLVDFGDVKRLIVDRVHDRLDHAMIVWVRDDVLLDALDREGWAVVEFPYVPTAENLARWCYEELAPAIASRFRDGLRLVEVAVWETPTSVAYFGEADAAR
jgi:6-pyruvoyltetrahydropterin/6-carboxytetrahydropterin synthase